MGLSRPMRPASTRSCLLAIGQDSLFEDPLPVVCPVGLLVPHISMQPNRSFSGEYMSSEFHTAGLSGKPGIIMEPASQNTTCDDHKTCESDEYCGPSVLKSNPGKNLAPASHCYKSE